MKKPKEVITPRWRVFILRKKAERLAVHRHLPRC